MKVRDLLVVLLVAATVMAISSCESVKKPLPGYTAAELDSFMVISVHTKFLERMDLEIEEARVSPEIWSRLSVKDKQTSARMLAWLCAAQRNKQGATPNITVINHESGETLARYNEMLGYSSQ